MTNRIFTLRTIIATLAMGILTAGIHAADPQVDAVMKRMRDTLRTTMTQLQTSEAEKVAVQTQLAESDQKNKDLAAQVQELTKKLDAQTKQTAADKAASEKVAADLNASIATRTHELALVNEALAKWKEGYNKVANLAREKDAERGRLASRVVALDQKVADRERQNIELYKTGKEILTRYENFGLGNALLAREPFVGTARVKMQNQVQDYQDKLIDQKIKPSDPHPSDDKNSPGPAARSQAAASKTPAGKNPDQKSKS